MSGLDFETYWSQSCTPNAGTCRGPKAGLTMPFRSPHSEDGSKDRQSPLQVGQDGHFQARSRTRMARRPSRVFYRGIFHGAHDASPQRREPRRAFNGMPGQRSAAEELLPALLSHADHGRPKPPRARAGVRPALAVGPKGDSIVRRSIFLTSSSSSDCWARIPDLRCLETTQQAKPAQGLLVLVLILLRGQSFSSR